MRLRRGVPAAPTEKHQRPSSKERSLTNGSRSALIQPIADQKGRSKVTTGGRERERCVTDHASVHGDRGGPRVQGVGARAAARGKLLQG